MAVSSELGDHSEPRGNAAGNRTPIQSARFVLLSALFLTTCNAGLVALPPTWDVAVAAVLAGLVLTLGRWLGLSWREMGLHQRSARSGVRWGLLALAVVALF